MRKIIAVISLSLSLCSAQTLGAVGSYSRVTLDDIHDCLDSKQARIIMAAACQLGVLGLSIVAVRAGSRYLSPRVSDSMAPPNAGLKNGAVTLLATAGAVCCFLTANRLLSRA